MEKKKKKLVTKKPVKKSAKIKTKAKVLRRKKNVEQNSEVIFDSKIGDTDALFVSEPEPDINEALKEIDDLQKYETTINNSDNVDKKEIVEKQKKVFSWRKFFSLNNRLFSILIGLVFAGVFITGTYVFAVVPLGQLEPGCAPGAAGCTVSTPLADSFTGNFSGSGDLTTTGSFHVKANNTYQYFGSADQAKIYYNGSNLVLDVGSGAKVLTLGDASQSSYKLNFNTGSGGTPSNPGTIIYTGGATKTFDFGNNAGNKILTTGLSIENSDGAVVYTLPITDGSGDQVLKTNGSGILSWATVSGGVDWTNASSNLLTTGKGSFGNTSVRGAFLNDGTYSIRSYGTVALSKPSLAPLLYFLDSTYTINAEGVSHFFNGIGKSVDLNDATYAVNATGNSLFTGNITVTGKGTFGDATLATKGVTLYDSLYAINAFGPNYLTNDTLNATLHVVSTGVGGSSDVLIGDGNLGYAINAVGGILFPTVYATTGLSGSNVKITSDGKLFRDSSSLRYKHDIEPLLGDFSLILQTQAKQFLYNGSDEQSIGYIAEDFDALGLKDLVTYDDQNRPDGINYDRIPVYTLEVVKQQQKDIDALKIAAGLSDAGVVGSGSLSSVSTNSLLSGLSSILSDAGITINGAIT
ncbi:MAG: hypothetical protein NTV36_01920, partial [Candidatus Staskawiczbacteria bacterium]|nr:hypothetical protein [Candidatus Staskawiczbacteria bacterium]